MFIDTEQKNTLGRDGIRIFMVFSVKIIVEMIDSHVESIL